MVVTLRNALHEVIMQMIKESIQCVVHTLTMIERSLKLRQDISMTREKGYPGLDLKVAFLLSPLLANIVLDKLDKYIESRHSFWV